MSLHVIVLAAGQGKRMMSDLPKVAHMAAGRPLIAWVLETVSSVDPETTVVVVGHGADEVERVLPDHVRSAVQEEQLGTGHATRVGMAAIGDIDPDDTVMVLYGDLPLLTPGLVTDLAQRGQGIAARLVVAEFEDATGYGRVIQDGGGLVTAIVEERDTTDEQRAIRDINAGVYSFRAGDLIDALGRISSDNAQGEYYLTDVIGILAGRGERIEPVRAIPEEVVGINSQDQLAEARRLLQARTNQRLMESGVWMLDPERTYVDDTVVVEPGARIYPGVHLEGTTTVGAGARVGPDVFVVDSSIGAGTTVWYAVLRGAVVGEDCEVGPYASLRPGSVLERGAKVGTFVETKNMTLGEQAKAPHLSYLGDASVGARSNIGAGTITCNYDGFEKHYTEIGEDVFVGSDTMLVAPLKIGDGAITGAGSVITEDVAEGALAIERTEQQEIPGYARRRAERQADKKSEG
ncbi:MAG TPA: bifunctional UDP-N-acetylglucosamine diphosphorylase/glucosamine-1-phosphate N-acetyltransferase GlmU [Acidimicrobiia bacterium]|nr:bifunctional UDP-N-acetylglucosamine diphosphorylase/glucosamine-1-phosphate N-acetyltransferase GlmU [Acidimicrobiia bacterium]